MMVMPVLLEDRIADSIKSKLLVSELEKEMVARLKKENVVRVLKRKNESCSYCSDGFCSDSNFRCGERGDAEENKDKIYKCNYSPNDAAYFLVVDDEDTLREIYKDILHEYGFEGKIDEAGCVIEAEELLKKAKTENRQYCGAIVDIRMPGKSGYELVNHIVERNYNTKIIMVSGTIDEHKPNFYFGDQDIIPNEKPVVASIEKSGKSDWSQKLNFAIKCIKESLKAN